MERKGLSDVITTVLIILVAIVAIGILGSFIYNFVIKGSSNIGGDSLTYDLSVEKAQMMDSQNLSVRVVRGGGGENIKKFKIVVYYSAGDSEVFEEIYELKELEKKSFVVKTKEGFNPVRVEVFPILIDGTGKEVQGKVPLKQNVIGVDGSTNTGYGDSGDGGVDEGEEITDVSLSFSSSLLKVNSGDSITLTWEASDARECSASGDWDGLKDLSGSETITDITSSKTFTLNCIGGTGASPAVKSLTVNLIQLTNLVLGGDKLEQDISVRWLCSDSVDGCWSTQMLWDISSIPLDGVIDFAEICLYQKLKIGTVGEDLRVSKINDITWSESSIQNDFRIYRSQSVVNRADARFSDLNAEGYKCFDVEPLLSNRGSKITFRVENPMFSNDFTSSFGTVDNSPILMLGREDVRLIYPAGRTMYTFGSRTNTNKPYLNVNYLF